MFIVIEGSDGSGKTTQFKLLTERLRATGYDVDVYDFPRYDDPSSYFVKRYLNGEYGPASEVSPYTASLFYALDRFEATPLIRQSLADGKIVLANRFAGSNMAHQGSKFTTTAQQRGYFMWADSLEFQLLGIPRPTLNIFLRVPADVAYELIKKKAARSYTSKIHDEHESDIEHLRRSVATYDTLCKLFPKDYLAIECAAKGKILTVPEINNRIWDLLKPMLPKPSKPGRSAVVHLEEKRPSKPTNVPQKTNSSTDMKDISLLALGKLLSEGADIKFDLKWSTGSKKPRLDYYIPSEFSPKLLKKYQALMSELTAINHKLAKSPAGALNAQMTVPLAALVDAKISSHGPTIDQLLSKVPATALSEFKQIASQTRAVLEAPKPLREIIAQLSNSHLGTYGRDDYSVKLISFQPRNELDLLIDCLYPQSNMAPDSIAAELDQWTYEQKAEALKAVIASKPDSVLEKTHYRFDIIEDLSIINQYIAQFHPDEIKLQMPTPRYGYRVPEEIEEAGLDGDFIKCFDLSLELYSEIQSAGHDELASYAVLVGHKQRWQMHINGWQALDQNSKVPSRASFLDKQVTAKIAEVHPLCVKAFRIPKAPSPNQKTAKATTKRRHSRSSKN